MQQSIKLVCLISLQFFSLTSLPAKAQETASSISSVFALVPDSLNSCNDPQAWMNVADGFGQSAKMTGYSLKQLNDKDYIDPIFYSHTAAESEDCVSADVMSIENKITIGENLAKEISSPVYRTRFFEKRVTDLFKPLAKMASRLSEENSLSTYCIQIHSRSTQNPASLFQLADSIGQALASEHRINPWQIHTDDIIDKSIGNITKFDVSIIKYQNFIPDSAIGADKPFDEFRWQTHISKHLEGMCAPKEIHYSNTFKRVDTTYALFSEGSVEIDTADFARLNEFISKYASDRNNEYVYYFEGFASSPGESNINLRLSQGRADNLHKHLSKSSPFSEKSVFIIGQGETAVFDMKSNEDWQDVNELTHDNSINQRASITIFENIGLPDSLPSPLYKIFSQDKKSNECEISPAVTTELPHHVKEFSKFVKGDNVQSYLKRGNWEDVVLVYVNEENESQPYNSQLASRLNLALNDHYGSCAVNSYLTYIYSIDSLSEDDYYLILPNRLRVVYQKGITAKHLCDFLELFKYSKGSGKLTNSYRITSREREQNNISCNQPAESIENIADILTLHGPIDHLKIISLLFNGGEGLPADPALVRSAWPARFSL